MIDDGRARREADEGRKRGGAIKDGLVKLRGIKETSGRGGSKTRGRDGGVMGVRNKVLGELGMLGRFAGRETD